MIHNRFVTKCAGVCWCECARQSKAYRRRRCMRDREEHQQPSFSRRINTESESQSQSALLAKEVCFHSSLMYLMYSIKGMPKGNLKACQV